MAIENERSFLFGLRDVRMGEEVENFGRRLGALRRQARCRESARGQRGAGLRT